MPSIYTLTKTLDHLRGLLIAHPAFVKGSGTAVDDPGHVREIEELEDIRKQLAIILREIKNKRNFLAMQERGAKKLPPADRFRTVSGARTQDKEWERLSALAEELTALIKQLTYENNQLNTIDAVGGLVSQIMETGENAHDLQALIEKSHGPTYNTQQHGEVGIEGALLPLIVALAMLVSFLKKKRSR